MISNHKLGNQAGYTFLELLVTVALSGIILATLTTSFISQSKSYNAQEQINEMQQSVRSVMDLMIREIRMAGYDPTDNEFNGIAVCNATTLRVRADVMDPADGLTTGTNEDITYSFSSGQILRNGATLAEDIVSLDFDCLDKNGGDVTVTLSPVRQIRIDITAETSGIDPSYSPTGGRRRYTLTSVVTPRNLAI